MRETAGDGDGGQQHAPRGDRVVFPGGPPISCQTSDGSAERECDAPVPRAEADQAGSGIVRGQRQFHQIPYDRSTIPGGDGQGDGREIAVPYGGGAGAAGGTFVAGGEPSGGRSSSMLIS